MNKRKLGRTALYVSELCLDATKLGWDNDDTSAFALLDAYYAAGGRFIETLGAADQETPSFLPAGGSEELVGRWRQARGIDRDKLVLATRLAFTRPSRGGSMAFVNHVREACERSLRRLGTRHLDLLVCDWQDALVPLDDVVEAVDMLIRAGRLRHAVAGGFPAWRVVDSLHRSEVRNLPRFEAVQGEYSLLSRGPAEREILPMCREHRLGFVARSPLAGGFLAQHPAVPGELGISGRDWQSERFGCNVGDAVLDVLGGIADRRRVPVARVALAWALHHPQVSSAVISAPGTRELDELLGATEMFLTPDEVAALAEVTSVQDPRMELRHV